MKGIYTVVGLENFLCTRKAYHTRFFQTFLILKAGCLPFYNLVHYYDSIFQKLVLCQKVLMYLKVFLWAERKTGRFQYDLEQKGKFPRFPSFRFCSIPKIENSEISENSLLIQILRV